MITCYDYTETRGTGGTFGLGDSFYHVLFRVYIFRESSLFEPRKSLINLKLKVTVLTITVKSRLQKTRFFRSVPDSLLFYFHCSIVFTIVLHKDSGRSFLECDFLKAGLCYIVLRYTIESNVSYRMKIFAQGNTSSLERVMNVCITIRFSKYKLAYATLSVERVL